MRLSSNSTAREASGLCVYLCCGRAPDGKLGKLGCFLLYFEVGTNDFLPEEIDDRAECGTIGNCISSTLGVAFPGTINTASSSAGNTSTVLASLLSVLLSSELPIGLSLFRNGSSELPISCGDCGGVVLLAALLCAPRGLGVGVCTALSGAEPLFDLFRDDCKES